MNKIFEVLDLMILQKATIDDYYKTREEVRNNDLPDTVAREIIFLLGDVDYAIDCLLYKYDGMPESEILIQRELAKSVVEAKEEYIHLWQNFPRKYAEGDIYCYVCGSALKYDYFVKTEIEGSMVIVPSRERCMCCEFVYDFNLEEISEDELKSKVLAHRKQWAERGYNFLADDYYRLKPRSKRKTICNMYAHARYIDSTHFAVWVKRLFCSIRNIFL